METYKHACFHVHVFSAHQGAGRASVSEPHTCISDETANFFPLCIIVVRMSSACPQTKSYIGLGMRLPYLVLGLQPTNCREV